MLQPALPIFTPRLLLRPFAPADLDALHAIHAREDVARYLYSGSRTRDQVRVGLVERAGQVALRVDGDKLILAMVMRASAELVGEVTLIWLSREHRQGEVGFVVHPDHHGRGLAHEAASAMIRLGFEKLRLRRIIGRCDARNAASARLMTRLGMRLEAHFRENELVKGEWCDEQVHAILADEWVTSRR